MVMWDGTEVVSRCLPWGPDWGSLNLSRSSQAKKSATENGKVDPDNRGVTVTLILSLGPPLFLPWSSEVTLTNWSQSLAKGLYKKSPAGSEIRFCNFRMQLWAFLPIELSHLIDAQQTHIRRESIRPNVV